MTSQSVGRGITRNRERLACTECRRRKLKCNRSLPCSTCTRRGVTDSCTYQRLHGSESEQTVRAEERLQQLEKLVQNLISDSSNDAPVGASSGASGAWEDTPHWASSSSGLGQQRGSTHWRSALEDIQELRSAIGVNYYNDDEQLMDVMHEQRSHEPMGILFGSYSPMSLQTILATYLPSRQNVDRLTSTYFRAQSISAPFIHSRHFRRLYASFWADPFRTSPHWISLLFSICHISINALRPNDNGTEVKNNRFSQAAAHCLALGEYYRPKPFVVEGLLLFIQSHCLTSAILPPDIAPVLATLIRVATAMGYHQPPPRPGMLSPFEAEIRRRTWSLCMQLDLLVSFHLGLPSAMRFSSWPCDPPRNLSDADFDESSKQLPPSRPKTEPTGMIFMIEKHNYMVVFDKIQQHVLSARSRSAPDAERELVELDLEVRRVHDELPDILQPLPMKDSVFDSPNVIVTRLCVTMLYCKCQIVLHRQHVLSNRPDSFRTCYEAAAMLVRDFCDAYDEFAPGGQVETEKWFMSSVTTHDFLLGAMALCLVALASARAGASYIVDRYLVISLLERGRETAVKLEPSRGPEAGHVRRVIDSTLQQLQALDASSTFLQNKTAISTSDDFQIDWDIGPQDTGDSLWDEFLAQYLNFDGGGSGPSLAQD